MIIHHLHAENVLSFGGGHNALDIDIHSGLNMLVGPNGAGKSNVLRALEIVLAHFSDAGGLRPARPPAPPHKPLQPNAPIRIACDVEWNTNEERALWTAFLIGALVPRGRWDLPRIEKGSAPSKSLPVDGPRLNQYLAAISELDFTPAVALLGRQQLVVEIEVTRGRVELTTRLPRLGRTVEMTRGGLLQPATMTGWSGSVRLSELYVRTLGEPLRRAWIAFWEAEGELPHLPPLDWERCLDGLGAGEAVELEPFAGSQVVPLEWPPAVWPLLKIDPQMGAHQTIQWRTIVGTLIRGGYLRWDRWSLRDPAPWTSGASLAEYLRDGALGPALLTLASQGHQGQTAYRLVCERFEELTNTSLAYQVLDPTPGQEEPAPTDVQAVTGDDIPIQDSGSGRAQVALLLLMLATRGAVLALDEPEQALHPVLQARMARQWVDGDKQTLVVTHSPYLLPLGHLECVKHVHHDRGSGCSRVTPPPATAHRVNGEGGSGTGPGETLCDEQIPWSLATLSPSTLAKQLRWPGDGLWLFARAIVLVEGVGDASALSVWFDKWLAGLPGARRRWDGQSIGVLFWPNSGNTGIIPMARVLTHYDIPWVALYDADTLSSQKNRKKTNERIWLAWHEEKFIADDPDTFAAADFEYRLKTFPLMGPDGQPQIFVRGTKETDNLDTLPEVVAHRPAAGAVVDGGPNLYRVVAEESNPPVEFQPLFERVVRIIGQDIPLP